MPDDAPIDVLGRALEQSVRVVSAVQPDQLDLPTPCSEWTVRDVLRHMVGGTRNFRAVAEGGQMQSFDVTVEDADLLQSYRDGAAALVAAWRVDGALDRSVTMFGGEVPASFPLGLQITETAVHSWDVAVATGQPASLDGEIAEFALAFATQNMGPERRGHSFGPPREAPKGAGPAERLAAFTGREVEPVG